MAARYDAFVVLTSEDAGYWGALPNLHVIPNPRTFSFDAPADPANRTVLASGRYSRQKGFERLIEAWKMIDTTGWTLRIAGSGDPTADGGVPFPECPANVVLGPSNDMRREYLNASIFALSSRYEGLPMVLLEAQAAGLPIVSFACQCGPRDIVHEGVDGFLVPEDDITALAAKLKQLMDDEDLRRRMGQAAFEASPSYDLEVIMQQWMKLFEDVMDPHKGDPSASPQDDEKVPQDEHSVILSDSEESPRKDPSASPQDDESVLQDDHSVILSGSEESLQVATRYKKPLQRTAPIHGDPSGKALRMTKPVILSVSEESPRKDPSASPQDDEKAHEDDHSVILSDSEESLRKDPSASPQDNERKTVVVSAVNLRKGGTLTILRSCLKYLSEKAAQSHRIIALVHDRTLCDYPGIEYIEFPNTIKSWDRRLWCEYVTMHEVSKQIAKEDGHKVWMWLSLHDTTPRVEAEHRQVYCHTSFPFLKVRWRDFIMDPKIPLFAMFTRVAYRINIHKNEHIIVQQNWFRDAMSRMLKVSLEKFRVIPPSMPSISDVEPAEIATPVPMFLYASTADCHKNFENLCEAARLLEQEIGKGHFRLVLTIKGDENRYARWLYKRWGTVESIDFHGFMDKAHLFGHYKAAHRLVFPSRVETWGLPISENIALGNGRMLLADLPYAHETAAGATEVKFFNPDDISEIKKLMLQSLQ